MKRLRAISRAPIISGWSTFAFVVLQLVSCQSINYLPPVTSEMARARTGRQVNLATLREGRTLFAHRCIECHTLPPLWHYTIEDWPDIVRAMAHRAGLKPAERDAIVAYIQTVRSR
jgi:mono/diheme cytochrome c family protein